jgi:hypothetical protein
MPISIKRGVESAFSAKVLLLRQAVIAGVLHHQVISNA